MTLGKPLHFCNAQCGHLYDDGADATGITSLEFYNQALNNGVKVEIALMVVSTLLHGFSEHLGGLVPITLIRWQYVGNPTSTQEVSIEVLSGKCLFTSWGNRASVRSMIYLAGIC